MVRNMDLLRTIFEQLRELGFKIAMDDFGTGYASLEILKTVPADIVKIDQTFVRDIKISKFDKTFIRFYLLKFATMLILRYCWKELKQKRNLMLLNRWN